MNEYSLVLSDELQIEYYKFKTGAAYDTELIKRLLHYYKPSFLTNTSQLKRTAVGVADGLCTKLRKAGLTSQSLEELANKTKYKIILSTEDNQFPYVNINGDKIENNLSGSFYRSETRQKAIAHIKALCSKADEICIYDRYLSARDGMENLNMLKTIFPTRKLMLIYHPEHIVSSDIAWLGSACPDWEFKADLYLLKHHDRYLIIDNQLEIILTSGFASISDTVKELTYIVRPVSENRLKRH